MTTRSYRIRLRRMAVLLLCWLLAALAVHLRHAWSRRDRLLRQGELLALKRAHYWPPRARIVDLSGRPLAWSEKSFDLAWTAETPPPPELQTELRRSGLLAGDGRPKCNLRPAELELLEPLLRRSPSLELRPRLIRRIAAPELRPLLGEVVERDGRQVGVSGLEAAGDRQLAGTPGEYEVLLDRHRNWIDSSLKINLAARPGRDLAVDPATAATAAAGADGGTR